jgi:hypothetical protein
MSIKQFEVAAEQTSKDPDEGTVFEVKDKREHGGVKSITAYKPSDGQFAMLLANVGRGTSEPEKIAGFINFVIAIMDDDGADYLAHRLLERKDPFGVEQMQEIMEWLVEEWSGNPTQEPSGSASSQQNDGPRSTPPTGDSIF